ncbi:MAG: methylated-DNA--[protein]-cysteine S-methyltransferase [Defluviitaleaceae bacterium]|nr:methylated-DNA--[protein]-cysteine S-methyltransferase [Defluviitaleaceae bacterium]
MLRRRIIDTPFLEMVLVSDGMHLVKSDFLYDEAARVRYEDIPLGEDAILTAARHQMGEYFAKQRRNFDLPLLMPGTDFQQKVWQVLKTIPYGDVLTYKEIAQKAGSPKAFRAAGGACRANHFAVIVPCHRVLSTSGAYTGYAGNNIFMKENLLNFESCEGLAMSQCKKI